MTLRLAQHAPFPTSVRTVTTSYIAFALLLISLQSFYFDALGGALFPYLGAALLVPLALMGGRLSPRVLVLVVLFMAIAAPRLLSSSMETFKATAGLLLGLGAFAAASSACHRYRDEVAGALRIVLWVHLFFFGLQVAYFAVTGVFLDFVAVISDLHTTYMSQKAVVLGNMRVPRFTGLHQEPGNYSAFTIGLLAAEFALSRRLTRLTWLALASIMATVSLAGMIFVMGFLTMAFASRLTSVRYVIATMVIGLPALLASTYWMLENWQKRAELFDGALLHRWTLDWALSPQATSLFGLAPGDIPWWYSAGYVGAWLDFYIGYGLAGLLLLAGFALTTANVIGMGLMGLVLLTKLKITYPAIFVYLAIIDSGMGSTRRPGCFDPLRSRYDKSC